MPLGSEPANVNGPFDPIASVSAPSRVSVRPEPARPLTVPPTVNESVEQLTAIPVTGPPPTVPLPGDTVQFCQGLVGCAGTVTA